MELTIKNFERLINEMIDLSWRTYNRYVRDYGEDHEYTRREMTTFSSYCTIRSLLENPDHFKDFCEIYELKKEEDSK